MFQNKNSSSTLPFVVLEVILEEYLIQVIYNLCYLSYLCYNSYLWAEEKRIRLYLSTKGKVTYI